MTNIQIETFIRKIDIARNQVKISFKTRDSFVGMFVATQDAEELKKKNFWRIISAGNLKNYIDSKDTSLAKIFNGHEITNLKIAETIG